MSNFKPKNKVFFVPIEPDATDEDRWVFKFNTIYKILDVADDRVKIKCKLGYIDWYSQDIFISAIPKIFKKKLERLLDE